MKQLISATLSKEAADIYNNWEKQKKSARISELIVKENSVHNHVEALIKRTAIQQQLLGDVLLKIWQQDHNDPLVRTINEMLWGTIHYQFGWAKVDYVFLLDD